ncbi:MAG: PQQ-binding-like beta-propeller repeat protein, partial [Planctomycetota bacterium]
ISGASIPSPSIVQETADGRLVLAPVDKLSLLKQTGSSLDVVWRGKGSKPGSPSPIVYGDRVFVIARGGILSAIELETGEQAFKKRLKGTFWATPLAAEGRLYCINESGTAFVVDAAGKGEILAKCDFGESIYGSPAVADDGMFVRSNAKLWKIAVIEQARATTGARQQ